MSAPVSNAHHRVFQSQPDEFTNASPRIHGTLPAELRGTVLRNGPGLLASGSDRLAFLDGHGYVAGVTFRDGTASCRGRHVRTPEFRAEQAAGRLLVRRVFTNLPSRWANLFKLPKGDSGNHDVYVFGGMILASSDQGHHALDAGTLETRGPERYNGIHAGKRILSPMPRVDPATGGIVAYVIDPGGPKPDKVTFFEADTRFQVTSRAAPHVLSSSPMLVHDLGFTPRYYVATQAAARLGLGAALWGKKTLVECFDWKKGFPAELIVVSRPDGARSFRVPIPNTTVAFHVINAHDDGAHLVVYVLAYAGKPGFELFAPGAFEAARPGDGKTPPPRILRLVVDPVAQRLVEHRVVGDVAGDLPEIRADRVGQPNRLVWLGAPAVGSQAPDVNAFPWFGAIVGVNLESGAVARWDAGPTTHVSQAAFAPRPGGTEEDDGWLLVWAEEGTAGLCEVLVFDAKALAAGPIARVELGVHLPAASHITWASGLELQRGA